MLPLLGFRRRRPPVARAADRVVCVVAAAIIGDQVGYLFGRKVGPALFSRPDSRFFEQHHVHNARAFIEKYGAKTIVPAPP
ncbi:MAG TPA: hypothetical protein VM282_24200 [Acidimicrobiales bacterium]|nr:hypothetical protein [Acidimicrobiales bacterium]